MTISKPPTTTCLVIEALRAADDFCNRQMLMVATGRNSHQVDAATHHLRKRHAVDCVVEPDGSAWWYALPSAADDRSYHVDERTVETAPRRRKKKLPAL